MVKARVLATVATFALCAVIVTTAGASAASASSVAPGSPGGESYFDLARKDCVGTARNTTSKVWFTVADGVLSDTYWPTIDATNVNTLQYLVTDGHSFTDLQTRDMTYKVHPRPDRHELHRGCAQRRGPPLPDPHHLHRRSGPRRGPDADDASRGRAGDQLYVRLDPLAGGTGGGRLSRTPAATPPSWSASAATCPSTYNTNTVDRRGQPRLRGPDLHGARVLERVLERERRLCRHRQRRPDDARHRPTR